MSRLSWLLILFAVALTSSVAGAQEVVTPPISEPEAQPAKPAKPAKKGRKRDSRKPKISGYAQAFYKHRLDTNGDDTSEAGLFRMQRVRVRVEGFVLPWVSYQFEMDPRSPTIGGVLRDGFFDLHRVIPRHRLRIGQQKPQFGYENQESSSRLYTVTRSELSEGPARGFTLRDIGVSVIGRFPLGNGWRIEDAVSVVNGSGMNVQVDDTRTKNVWGRAGVRYRPKGSKLELRVGVSGALGNQLEPADPADPETFAYVFDFVRAGVDVEVDSKWVFAAAEVVTSSEESANPEHPTDQLGWYVLLVGKTPWDAGPVLRYDTLDTEEWTRWTFGGYWGGPREALRLMATYEIFEDEIGAHDHRVLLWSQVSF